MSDLQAGLISKSEVEQARTPKYPAITCPTCFRTSHHPMDVAERYCSACGRFHAEMGTATRTPAPRRTEEYPDRAELAALQLLPVEDHYFLARLMTIEGCENVKPLPGRRYAALRRYGFTTAIITGRLNDVTGFDNRWCYHDHGTAAGALAHWNGVGEPVGWHRHPATGRRLAESLDCYDDNDNHVPPGELYVRG